MCVCVTDRISLNQSAPSCLRAESETGLIRLASRAGPPKITERISSYFPLSLSCPFRSSSGAAAAANGELQPACFPFISRGCPFRLGFIFHACFASLCLSLARQTATARETGSSVTHALLSDSSISLSPSSFRRTNSNMSCRVYTDQNTKGKCREAPLFALPPSVVSSSCDPLPDFADQQLL